MHQGHAPNPRIVATILTLPWAVIWIAALIVLAQRRPAAIPFEYPLAWLLVIASPLIAWNQLRRMRR